MQKLLQCFQLATCDGGECILSCHIFHQKTYMTQPPYFSSLLRCILLSGTSLKVTEQGDFGQVSNQIDLFCGVFTVSYT